MHYKAERSITPDGESIIEFVATFLLMDSPGYDTPELVKFLQIMESEINQGSSFDVDYFNECKRHLNGWLCPTFGSSIKEQEAYRTWLSKLDHLETQNIINTHKNRAKSKPKSLLLHRRKNNDIATTA